MSGARLLGIRNKAIGKWMFCRLIEGAYILRIEGETFLVLDEETANRLTRWFPDDFVIAEEEP